MLNNWQFTAVYNIYSFKVAVLFFYESTVWAKGSENDRERSRRWRDGSRAFPQVVRWVSAVCGGKDSWSEWMIDGENMENKNGEMAYGNTVSA